MDHFPGCGSTNTHQPILASTFHLQWSSALCFFPAVVLTVALCQFSYSCARLKHFSALFYHIFVGLENKALKSQITDLKVTQAAVPSLLFLCVSKEIIQIQRQPFILDKC